MSIEQLIVLIIFVVIPLIQALRRSRESRREAELEPEDGEREEPLPHWPAPVPPPLRMPPVQASPVRPAPAAAPAPHAPTPRPVEQPARKRKRRTGAEALRRLGLAPNDPRSLRRAMALMAVLGRPRALDPYQS